jgi:hypothetical protein
MGTWGTGILDNDRSSDFLEGLVSQIIAFIESQLAEAEVDNVLERPTIAAVASLRSLFEGLLRGSGASHLISKGQVQAWRSRYLEWFDKSSCKMGGDERTIAGIRQNVAAEFERLLKHLLEEE